MLPRPFLLSKIGEKMPKVKKSNNAKPAAKPKTRKRKVLHCADSDSLEMTFSVYSKSIVNGKIKICLSSAGDTNIVHMQGDSFDHLKVGQKINIIFN